ncbi:MAG: autotransporter-associated beta strand repeat-containing protein [Terrimicrobiaceae bacterium]|nr:autotransporter-associated beta strand repeat-containing protein [Terrimicrobiaceae bacterium]
MKPSLRRSPRVRTFCLLAAATLAAIGAQAAPPYIYWNGAGTGWDLAADWSTSANAATPNPLAVPGSGDIAVFVASNITTAQTINLNGPQSALGLVFGNRENVAASAVTLQGGGTNQTLSLGASGIQSIPNALGAVTIGSTTAGQAVNISLTASQTWTNLNNLGLNIVNNVSSTAPGTTLTINSFSNVGGTTFSGVISDGTGTTALTIVNGNTTATGNVTLTGANTYTGATTIKEGTVLLDFSNATAPVTNIIGSSSALVLGGGTTFNSAGTANNPILSITGKSGLANSQTFNGTTLHAGSSTFTFTQNSAASLSASLGAIVRNGNATLNFSLLPTSGAISTTNTNDATGILGAWATTGANATLNYATVTGGNIVAYTGATVDNTGTLAGLTSATTNYTTSSSAITLGANATANTLQFTGGAAGGTLALGANTLTLNGWLSALTGATTNLSITSTGAGAIVIGANKELVFVLSNNSVFNNAPIVDNPGGASGITFNGGANNLVLTGVSTYTGTTSINSGILVANAAEVAGVSGAFGNGGNITFNGGQLTYGVNAAAADYSSRIKNSASAISLGLGGNGNNIIWNSAVDSTNTGGLVINSGGFAKLTLNGANSFTGNTLVVGNSYVEVGNKSAFGSSSNLVIVNTAAHFSANTDLTGANAIPNSFQVLSGLLNFQGSHSIEVTGSIGHFPGQATRAISNDISGGSSLILSGTIDLSATTSNANTLFIFGSGVTNITGSILNGVAGTTNATSISYVGTGTLVLGGTNAYTGSTFVGPNNGTVELDFSAPTAPTTNIIASGPGTIQLGGSTLNLTGKAGLDNSQATSATVVNSGASSLVLAPGAGGHVLYTGGGFNRQNGGTLDITLSGTSDNTLNGVTTTSTNDAGGILKGFTVGRNDWATNGTNVSGGSVIAYSGYTDQNDVTQWTNPVQNITNTTTGAFTGSLAGAATINTLRFDSNVAGGPNLGGQVLTVTDGILITGNVSSKALTINNGTLQSGAAAADLIVINRGSGATTLDIGATIADNGASPTPFVKSGEGLVTLSGANTYTGQTIVTQGVLKAEDGVSLPSASNLLLKGGVLGISTDFTRTIGTNPGNVQFGGGSGGFAAYGGTHTVTIGIGLQVNWRTGLLANGSTLILGDSSADGMVDFVNPIELDQATRTVQANNGSAPIDAKLSGVISSNSNTGLTKTGTGTLWLSAANTFVGALTVKEGTLTENGTGTLNNFVSVIVDGATAVFDLGADHNQNSSAGSAVVTLDNGGSITGTGTSSVIGRSFDVRSGSVSAILAGGATLTKTTSGTVTLSGANTYTGATTVNAGVLAINGSSASAVTVNAGTLRGTGSTNAAVAVTIGNGTGSNDAIIAPGNSVGTFTVGGPLTLNSDAQYKFELNSTTGLADKIIANGVTITGATFNFTDLALGSGITIGTVFTIIDNTGAGPMGTFSNLANGGSFNSGNYHYVANYSGGDGNDLTLTATAVPEPSVASALGFTGLLAICVLVLRRRHAQVA